MVISDLFSLFSLAKIFADGKRDLNRAFFDKFIQPAWVSFARLHERYEKSLQEYARLLDEGISVKQLAARIANDRLYSATLRLELSRLHRYNFQVDQSIREKRELLLSNFAGELINYFNTQQAFQDLWELDGNPAKFATGDASYRLAMRELQNPRSVILGYLAMMQAFAETLSPEQIRGMKRTVYQAFKQMIRYLQDRYMAVADCYYALRVEMLKS